MMLYGRQHNCSESVLFRLSGVYPQSDGWDYEENGSQKPEKKFRFLFLLIPVYVYEVM